MATDRQTLTEIAKSLGKMTPKQIGLVLDLLQQVREMQEAAPLAEAREYKRLERLFEGMPENKRKLAEGLFAQAARLRVRLNELHRDIQENGMVEMFQQSEKVEPYPRERPQASLFVKLDKNYQAIIRQLTDLVPAEMRKTDDLADFLNDDG